MIAGGFSYTMEKELIIKKTVDIIRNHLSREYKIYLFGSWARGDATGFSDIDIGILGPDKVPWETMVKILEEVDDIPTLRSVDVLDLNSKSFDFRNNVLSYGLVL